MTPQPYVFHSLRYKKSHKRHHTKHRKHLKLFIVDYILEKSKSIHNGILIESSPHIEDFTLWCHTTFSTYIDIDTTFTGDRSIGKCISLQTLNMIKLIDS